MSTGWWDVMKMTSPFFKNEALLRLWSHKPKCKEMADGTWTCQCTTNVSASCKRAAGKKNNTSKWLTAKMSTKSAPNKCRPLNVQLVVAVQESWTFWARAWTCRPLMEAVKKRRKKKKKMERMGLSMDKYAEKGEYLTLTAYMERANTKNKQVEGWKDGWRWWWRYVGRKER